MQPDEDITLAAVRLIERHGAAAAEQARARAEQASRAGDLRLADLAWRVLSEVERRLADVPAR